MKQINVYSRWIFTLFFLGLSLAPHFLQAQDSNLNPIPHSMRVYEEVSMKPISKAVVRVYEGDSIVGQHLTDTLGLVRFSIYPHRLWKLQIVSKDHYTMEDVLDTRDLADIKLVTRVGMLPKGVYQFKGVLLDEAMEYFLPNVNVKLIDETTRRTFYNASNERGVFFFPLVPKHNYTLQVDDDIYFKSKAIISDCSDKFTDDNSVGVFCTSGFNLQDYKFNTDTKQRTLVGTMRLQKLELGKEYALKNIYYDYGKADIRADAALVLDTLYILLMENPQIKIELSSHTDSRGSAGLNASLSQRRAVSARNYLLKKGIPSERIVAKGYGETQLINHCKDGVSCTDKQHAENRRTVFKILEIRKP